MVEKASLVVMVTHATLQYSFNVVSRVLLEPGVDDGSSFFGLVL